MYPLLAGGVGRAPLFADSKERVGEPVYFAGDGLPLAPAEYAIDTIPEILAVVDR